MSRLLDRLYAGTLQPQDDMQPRDRAYWAVNRQFAEKERTWEKRLSEAERQEWDELEERCLRWESMARSAAFRCGFRLGAGLFAEAFSDQSEEA